MFKKIILAVVAAAATLGTAYAGGHDPYTNATSGQWMQTAHNQTLFDPMTIYHASGGGAAWTAVWMQIDQPNRVSHGFLMNREVDRIAIICQSHAYAVISASLYKDGDFLIRHDYNQQEIARSMQTYANTSPVGAVATQVCPDNPQWN